MIPFIFCRMVNTWTKSGTSSSINIFYMLLEVTNANFSLFSSSFFDKTYNIIDLYSVLVYYNWTSNIIKTKLCKNYLLNTFVLSLVFPFLSPSNFGKKLIFIRVNNFENVCISCPFQGKLNIAFHGISTLRRKTKISVQFRVQWN